MSYICDICGKSNMAGNLVSHSKQRMHRLFKPNLHSAKAIVNGVVKKMLVCTKCLRRLKRPDKKIEKIEMKKEVVSQVTAKEAPASAKAMAGREVKVKQTTVAELMKETVKTKPTTTKKATAKRGRQKKI